MQPFGDSGKGSLAELNKLIQESAEKPQATTSSDTSSNGGSRRSCSTGSVSMKVLPKGVPVGVTSTKP